MDALKDAGFTNIEVTPLGDLITGWLDDPGTVKEVEVNGVTSFEKAEVFNSDAEFVISYHSFPEDAEGSPESATPSEEPSANDNEVITASNNDEFAAILKIGDYCSPVIAAFAKKYQGATVKFDGSIVSMGPHDDYKTRYDILLAPGDYSENAGAFGAAMIFQDVNIFDLNLAGSDIPDTVGLGDNLRITAQIDVFNSGGCLLLLTPISTEIR